MEILSAKGKFAQNTEYISEFWGLPLTSPLVANCSFHWYDFFLSSLVLPKFSWKMSSLMRHYLEQKAVIDIEYKTSSEKP